MSDERYVLVPVVATAGMMDAASGVSIGVYSPDVTTHWTVTNHDEARELWSAMLSAAPPPDDAVIERVAKCDREAAACRHDVAFGLGSEYASELRQGLHDSDEIVQAFARHRTAAIAALCGGRVDG